MAHFHLGKLAHFREEIPNVFCLCGKLEEIFYDERGVETERFTLCPSEGKYGCIVPKGVWHTVNVIEPTIIYESKDGKYGEDGSEIFTIQ